ncbi:MAG: pitrilysin family protein [Candidatus Eisenbacteria bacterium]
MKLSYRKDVLPNGIRIVTESSRDAGSVSLGFWVGVGSSLEPLKMAGVSHFIEHILFKGTAKRSAFELANVLESVGGSIDAFAGRESTAFVARCLSEHMGKAVDVISDMLCGPAMREKDIELEKRVVFEEIRSLEDTPEDVAHELLAASVWRKNPVGKSVLGTGDTVGRFTRGSVMPFFKSFYASPNIIVAASGRVDHRRLVGSVNRMLKVPAKCPPPGPQTFSSGVARVHNAIRRVSQCYICLGVEAPPYTSGRRFANMMLSMIVGGGMTSRLFQEVREKEALAYTVYGSCEFYRNTGIFFVFLAVDPKKAKKAIGRVVKELKKLKTNGLARGELSSVKQQFKGGLLLGLESSAARMNRLVRHEFYLNDYHPIEDSLRKIRRIKESDIMDEARLLLDPSAFSLVTVGPSTTDFPSESDLSF